MGPEVKEGVERDAKDGSESSALMEILLLSERPLGIGVILQCL